MNKHQNDDFDGNQFEIQNFDKTIHEPARLIICGILNSFEEVTFNFLLSATSLSNGNLATHLQKLEDAGYINVKKEFQERKPCTSYSFSSEGKKAYKKHIQKMKLLIDKLDHF